MTVIELQEKLSDLPPDATVSCGTNGNDVIIVFAILGFVAFVIWLALRGDE